MWRQQTYTATQLSGRFGDITRTRYEKNGATKTEGRPMLWKYTNKKHYGINREGEMAGLDAREALANADRLDYEDTIICRYENYEGEPVQMWIDDDGSVNPTHDGKVVLLDMAKVEQEKARRMEQNAKITEYVNLIHDDEVLARKVLHMNAKQYNDTFRYMPQTQYNALIGGNGDFGLKVDNAFKGNYDIAKYEARADILNLYAQSGHSHIVNGAHAKIACLVREFAAVKLVNSRMTEEKAIGKRNVPDDGRPQTPDK